MGFPREFDWLPTYIPRPDLPNSFGSFFRAIIAQMQLKLLLGPESAGEKLESSGEIWKEYPRDFAKWCGDKVEAFHIRALFIPIS
jgi:hypothetical protein